VSDRCIDYTYRIYFRLLKNYRTDNRWFKKIMSAMTKNTKIGKKQISNKK
jgi:hypothetical protein